MERDDTFHVGREMLRDLNNWITLGLFIVSQWYRVIEAN